MLDLEDAIGINKKSSARDIIVDFLGKISMTEESPRKRQHIVVRVNCPFSSEWGEDDMKAIR